MMEFSVPIYWIIGGRKRALSINVYRNMYYMTLNKVKQEYMQYVCNFLPNEEMHQIELNMTFYPKTMAQDMDNFTSVAQKFILDSLVHKGIIQSDTIKYVYKIVAQVGRKDKENPRIEVKVIELGKS